MDTFTIGDYLAERFAQVGIRNVFVVPGDYNLVLLDKIQAQKDLSEIGCTNELNCSMAAEGYARANGAAACVVTYSVGAFSAFNGIGSAYAENLPVILVSGSPNTNDTPQFHLLHHTLGRHDFTYQLEMAKRITCCAVAVQSPLEAPHLIDSAIRAALMDRKPAYIEIPTNLAGVQCARPGPISAITDPIPSDELSLTAAADEVAHFLRSRVKPIILVGPKIRRVGAERELLRLTEAMGCAVAVQPAAKGSFPEDHPQFIGIFWGQVSTQAADAIVNWADAIICAGTVFTDYSTVGWTAYPDVPQIIAEMDHVTLTHPRSHFNRVRLGDFLSNLAEKVPRNNCAMVEYNRLRPDPPIDAAVTSQSPLTRKLVSRWLQTLVTSKTTLFVDTGDSWFNGVQIHLPPGAEFEIEMQWGHIGWTIPASLGYALAKPDRDVVVIAGDGSFQMTAQEVSQMVRYNIPILIVLMNNRGYTIEVEIHDGIYNRIKNWEYAKLVEAFNSTDGGHALGIKVATAGELASALEKAKRHTSGPTLVECTIHQDDCSKELITWGHFVAAANARLPAYS